MHSGEARWLIHALNPKRNELRRPIDRGTAALTLSLIVAAVLVVPVAVLVGNAMYSAKVNAAARVASTQHEVEAVQTRQPEIRFVGDSQAQSMESWAQVRWAGHDGVARTGMAEVRVDSQVGSKVALKVDANSHIVKPPPTKNELWASAAIAAVTIAVTAQTVFVALIVGVRLGANVRTRRMWEREWAVTEPQWTRQQH